MAIAINGAGTITGLSVGGLPDGTVDEDTLANNAVGSGKLASGVGGKVLQCLSVTKTDTYTSGSSTLTNIPTLTLTITPATTSSKILMLASVSCDAGSAYWNYLGFARGGSAIGAGDASTNRINVHAGAGNNASTYGLNTIAMNYLDSPSSTSAQTYTIQTRHGLTGGVTYINRTGRDSTTSGSGYDGRYASTLTLFEIGA